MVFLCLVWLTRVWLIGSCFERVAAARETAVLELKLVLVVPDHV